MGHCAGPKCLFKVIGDERRWKKEKKNAVIKEQLARSFLGLWQIKSTLTR
jgi:hypothetical protein